MIVPFDWFHLEALEIQPNQKQYIEAAAYMGLKADCYTYLEDFIPKACFGMQIQWKGRALVWSVIGDDIDNWVAFHRVVKQMLNEHIQRNHINRCEMTTEVGFRQASRWARMLGFKKESVMPKYFESGLDAEMWVIL